MAAVLGYLALAVSLTLLTLAVIAWRQAWAIAEALNSEEDEPCSR